MLIWDNAPVAVLELFLSSTSRRFYFTEIRRSTGLRPATIGTTLRALKAAGYLQTHADGRSLDSISGARRVYYSLTPKAISVVRLQS